MAKLQSKLGVTPLARASYGVGWLSLEPASEHELFDVILPTGERIPYGRRGNG